MKPFSIDYRLISCLSLALVLAFLPGCSEEVEELEAGPSYADLVSIYTLEATNLERLEEKRKTLVKEHEEQLRPSPGDTLEALGDVLNSAVTSGAESGTEPNVDFDPNAMLDQAVADAQKVQDTTGKLLESLSSDREVDEEEAKRLEKLDEEFQQELAELDKKIEEQEARVDRARAARDAAEAKAAGQ